MKRYLLLALSIAAIAVISAQLETLPDWVRSIQQANPFLTNTFLKVHVWQWIGLGVIGFASFLLGVVIRWVTVRLTHFRDHFAEEPMADATRHAIGRSAGVIVGSIFAILLLNNLLLSDAFHEDLKTLLNAVALLGTVMFVYAAWDVACDSIASRSAGHLRAERLLVPMTRKLVRVTIIVCGCLCAVALFGGTRTIATMIGTLGIGGLVIALAGKDSVENLFGSFTIMFDMPFALGDWVKIGDAQGTVEQINLRSTRLRTAEDTVILLPNANLIRASVENFGSRRFHRIKMSLRLSYDCRPEQIDAYIGALREFLAQSPETDPDQALIGLADPTEVSLGLTIDCHVQVTTAADEVAMRHRILQEALRLRKPHGIVFAPAPRPPDP